ncbi:MAG: hypothetical protein QNJ94_01350 [Alphaproteobacteria bacterium]|nr:hypothetical protein [Alphaproteobacteria bacterium]
MRAVRALLPGLVCLILVVFGMPAAAGERGIADFYGTYVGQSISDPESGLNQRDLAVSISPRKGGKGFVVNWTTVIPKSDGRVSRKSFSIEFRNTSRADVFGSAMGKDMFGNLRPLDPLKGEPYVWARIHEDTLSVYMMLVTDNGDYEMQSYHRTLTENGMTLRFVRQREDRTLKVIEGELRREKG